MFSTNKLPEYYLPSAKQADRQTSSSWRARYYGSWWRPKQSYKESFGLTVNRWTQTRLQIKKKYNKCKIKLQMSLNITPLWMFPFKFVVHGYSIGWQSHGLRETQDWQLWWDLIIAEIKCVSLVELFDCTAYALQACHCLTDKYQKIIE